MKQVINIIIAAVLLMLASCAGIDRGVIVRKATYYSTPVFVGNSMYGPYKEFYILVNGVTVDGESIAELKKVPLDTYYEASVGDSVYFHPFTIRGRE